MKKKVYIRIAYNIGLFTSVLFFDWRLVIVFMVMGVVFFPRYYEAIAAGILTDLLYGVDGSFTILNAPIIFSTISFFVYLIGSRFKRRVRSYGYG
ncbi:MAG: hypothetical protein KAR24_00880 [Candidatus Pacebacteria bacterium]|nr:hypothetical protein [Candidatus Paceibacterota bacterium]